MGVLGEKARGDGLYLRKEYIVLVQYSKRRNPSKRRETKSELTVIQADLKESSCGK